MDGGWTEKGRMMSFWNPDKENGPPVWSMDQLALQHFFHVLLAYGLGQMLEKLVNQVLLLRKVAYVSTAVSHVPYSCGLPRRVLSLTLIGRLTVLISDWLIDGVKNRIKRHDFILKWDLESLMAIMNAVESISASHVSLDRLKRYEIEIQLMFHKHFKTLDDNADILAGQMWEDVE